MLPDLKLSIRLGPGQIAAFRVRDLPTGAFFEGFPETGSLGRLEASRAVEVWSDRVLTRAVVEPRLTPETVHRLGTAKDETFIRYALAIGYMLPSQPQARPYASGDPPIAYAEPSAWEPALRLASLAQPSASWRAAVRLIAAKGRMLSSQVWILPISEFLWNARLLLDDGKRGPTGMGDIGIEDALAAIGIEE